jgi:hypothetical protein
LDGWVDFLGLQSRTVEDDEARREQDGTSFFLGWGWGGGGGGGGGRLQEVFDVRHELMALHLLLSAQMSVDLFGYLYQNVTISGQNRRTT